MNIILAPHLDDEIIGCYSVLGNIHAIVYFSEDYRAKDLSSITSLYQKHIPGYVPEYVPWSTKLPFVLCSLDTVYLPSKYDYHPLHRKVRQIGLTLQGNKMFYSTEMNTPWLEEEENPEAKKILFQRMYINEMPTMNKNDKYFLFKSIKPWDDIIWASIRFQKEGFHSWPAAPPEVDFLRNKHRHMFHFEVDVQQFGDDRDLEFFILSRKVQHWFDHEFWPEKTSCEMFSFAIKRWLEQEYPDRMVRVSVREDNENGSIIE